MTVTDSSHAGVGHVEDLLDSSTGDDDLARRRAWRRRAVPRRLSRGDDDSAGIVQSPLLLGLLAGLQAAVVGLFVVVVPTFLSWLVAPGVTTPAGDVLRATGGIWLLAHRTTLSIPTGQVALVPLGITVVLAAVCWLFARRVTLALALISGRSRDQRAAIAHLGFVLAYIVVAVTVALTGGSPGMRPQTETAVLGPLMLAGLAAAPKLWAHRRGAFGQRTRPEVWLRATAVTLVFPMAVSVLLVGICLFLGYSRISEMYDALHPSLFDSIGLALVQFVWMPNFMVWGLSWLAGPGFSVGVGTSVTTSGTVLGPLPALPILGALPSPGTHPSWLSPAAMGVVALGGIFGGRVLARYHVAQRSPLKHSVADVAVTAALTGLGAGLLAFWSSGSLGGGLMATWGAPLAMAGFVAAQSLVGMLVAVAVWPRLHRGSWAPGSAKPTAGPTVTEAAQAAAHRARTGLDTARTRVAERSQAASRSRRSRRVR